MAHDTDQQPVQHPRWCLESEMCTGDGIHHSKPLVATSGDAYDLVRVWLECAHIAPDPSLVLETTVEGEVRYAYLPLGQARILVHLMRRLLDDAKRGGR